MTYLRLAPRPELQGWRVEEPAVIIIVFNAVNLPLFPEGDDTAAADLAESISLVGDDCFVLQLTAKGQESGSAELANNDLYDSESRCYKPEQDSSRLSFWFCYIKTILNYTSAI